MPAFLSKVTALSFNRESCMVSSGTMFVKNILLFINFLSMLAGLILIGGGGYIQSSSSDIVNLSGTIALSAILIGILITIISFLGCFGAANEKGMLLKSYFTLLIILIILELSVGAAAYAKKEDLVTGVEQAWQSTALKNESFRSSPLYKIESNLLCCGFRNVTDFAVPEDCAARFDFDKGCFEKIMDGLENSLDTIGVAGIVVGVIEFIGLVFSAILFNRIAKREQATSGLLNEAWRINKNQVQYGYQNYQYL